MDHKKINYFFNYKERFFTVQKDYKLRLQKTDQGVRMIKEAKAFSVEKEDTPINHGERFTGRMTAGGVYNQLSNIRQIVFEVTDACNLQCTYCSYGKFYGDYDQRENQYIDIHKSKMLIDFVVERLHSSANQSQHKTVVISFYGGEPLLNMEFIRDVVEYTGAKADDRVGFTYSMTTNGVFLKKEADFLVRHDFRVLVSLDGSEANDGHRTFHNGKSSFQIVYENLIYVRDRYPDFFKKNISFNAVLHNLNNESEVFHFFQREFDKIPMFSDVNDMGVKQDMEEEFSHLIRQKERKSDEELDTMMRRVLDLSSGENKNLQHFIFKYSGNVYRTYYDLLRKTDNMRYIPTATCYPFSKKIFMTVTGKILPCERIGHQFAMGKVTDSGVEIDCEDIAVVCNSYYDSLQKQCGSCYQAGHCIQCMYIIKNLENKPVCQGFSNKQKFENYLQGELNRLSLHPELYKRIMEEVVSID
ncbi:MAG TPA: radical SAM peptide maturase [Porphyromonadaceae bacterium]|nr:radical SAM peptide maturase [Porphyromonadaceae bacterium]